MENQEDSSQFEKGDSGEKKCQSFNDIKLLIQIIEEMKCLIMKEKE